MGHAFRVGRKPTGVSEVSDEKPVVQNTATPDAFNVHVESPGTTGVGTPDAKPFTGAPDSVGQETTSEGASVGGPDTKHYRPGEGGVPAMDDPKVNPKAPKGRPA